MQIHKHLLLGLVSILLVTAGTGEEISDQCLGCICHASTGCNKNQGCTETGVCGPFKITRPFWVDGGKLMIKGANPANVYADCSNDLYCAADTVRGYARKYGKDCDGNGLIDCNDFGIMHQTGPGACNTDAILQTAYFKKFTECRSRINPQ